MLGDITVLVLQKYWVLKDPFFSDYFCVIQLLKGVLGVPPPENKGWPSPENIYRQL